MGEPEPEVALDGVDQTAECHGGPFNGKQMVARRPKGFLLVDKAANKAWIYDWNGTAFVCRDSEGMALDYDKRMAAADDPDWDVVAYTEGEPTP